MPEASEGLYRFWKAKFTDFSRSSFKGYFFFLSLFSSSVKHTTHTHTHTQSYPCQIYTTHRATPDKHTSHTQSYPCQTYTKHTYWQATSYTSPCLSPTLLPSCTTVSLSTQTYGSKLMVMLALPSPISFFAVTLYCPPSSFVKFCTGRRNQHSITTCPQIISPKDTVEQSRPVRNLSSDKPTSAAVLYKPL